MEAYDVIMLLVLVGATVFGAWKGMAWQIASLASLAISYIVALRFSPQLAPLLGDQPPWNRLLAMLILYMATSLAIWLVFRVVSGFIDRLKLKEFDHQLGALFGLAKGVLLCVAITLFAVALLPDPQRRQIMDSRSGFYIAMLLDRADAVMPEEIKDVLHPYIHRAQEELEAASRAAPEQGVTRTAERDTVERR